MKPPFRADQVGSLLRPEALKEAREQYLGLLWSFARSRRAAPFRRIQRDTLDR